jgi:hypothetical protein
VLWPGLIMAARLRKNVLSFLALAAALASCEDPVATTSGVVHPTLVEVSPEDFLMEVPCQVGPGSMQVYVATLYDHGPLPLDDGSAGADGGLSAGGGEGGGWSPPSVPGADFPRRSNPVSCGTAVGFGSVTPGNRYSVGIQAFDREDLMVHEPFVEVVPEATVPDVRDVATGEVVPPRWTGTCGRLKPATARTSVVRRIRECTPLVDHQPSAVTGVELRPELALGTVDCGSGAGKVDHFEVTTSSGTRSVPCGEALVIDDATAGRTLVLEVLAFAAGESAALLGTTCTAVPISGVTVTATCSPFTDKGALEVDPSAAATALGLGCDTLRELTITPDGAAPLRVRPSACGSLVPLVGLPRGDQTVSVVAVPGDGSAGVTGTCSGTVVPGQRVLASCSVQP